MAKGNYILEADTSWEVFSNDAHTLLTSPLETVFDTLYQKHPLHKLMHCDIRRWISPCDIAAINMNNSLFNESKTFAPSLSWETLYHVSQCSNFGIYPFICSIYLKTLSCHRCQLAFGAYLHQWHWEGYCIAVLHLPTNADTLPCRVLVFNARIHQT